jgi:4a-hydroxytetrahydrobiopterin dehydratase
MSLAENACIPCKGGSTPLTGDPLVTLHAELGNNWQLIEQHHLEKEYSFKNFVEALAFTNKVGAIAEEQNHHPDILTCWGKTKVTIWTHKIDGLTESDFFFAAKCDVALGA